MSTPRPWNRKDDTLQNILSLWSRLHKAEGLFEASSTKRKTSRHFASGVLKSGGEIHVENREWGWRWYSAKPEAKKQKLKQRFVCFRKQSELVCVCHATPWGLTHVHRLSVTFTGLPVARFVSMAAAVSLIGSYFGWHLPFACVICHRSSLGGTALSQQAAYTHTRTQPEQPSRHSITLG